jgi:hypothetical protein
MMSNKQTNCARCTELETQIEHLEMQLQALDPFYGLKRSLPTHDEALTIWRRIVTRWPRMKSPTDSEVDQARSMTAAMAYAMSLTKVDVPITRYDGDWWIARAEEFASRARIFVPRIRSLLVAVIASNDSKWVLDNGIIFLNPYVSGPTIDRGAWKKLLSEATPLREPEKLDRKLDLSIGGIRVQGVNAW